jgi:hypothetical protein
MTDTQQTVRWGHHALELEISLADDGRARLVRLGTPGEATAEHRPGAALGVHAGDPEPRGHISFPGIRTRICCPPRGRGGRSARLSTQRSS